MKGRAFRLKHTKTKSNISLRLGYFLIPNDSQEPVDAAADLDRRSPKPDIE